MVYRIDKILAESFCHQRIMNVGMKRSLLYLLTGFIALLISVSFVSAAFTSEFKLLPFGMKNSSAASPYVDDAFMTDAGAVIESLSNTTVPTGTRLSDVSSAYYRLILDNVSPQLIETADNIIGYLYYASMAGEAYEDYHEYINSASKSSDGSEYYTLADQYRQVSAEYWKRISDRFPNTTMYTLPGANAEMPQTSDDDSTGSQLKGLEIPLTMTQKDYDPNSPDQTSKFKNITIKWFKDYVNDVNSSEDDDLLLNSDEKTSTGHKFLTGEGVKWADSTFLDLVSLNVAKDFIDKANYVDAFFTYIAQAEELYNDYAEQQNSFSSLDNGKKSYESADKYYTEAQKALEYFKDIIPKGTNSSLPDFPKFGEVEKTTYSFGELGNIGSDMSSTLGFDTDSSDSE